MKLYTDSEITSIYEGQVESPQDGLLKVVPSGQTKPISLIFNVLGLDPERLGGPVVRGLGKVNFFCWQVSPSYELSIMVSGLRPLHTHEEQAEPLKVDGYGVRLCKVSNASVSTH